MVTVTAKIMVTVNATAKRQTRASPNISGVSSLCMFALIHMMRRVDKHTLVTNVSRRRPRSVRALPAAPNPCLQDLSLSATFTTRFGLHRKSLLGLPRVATYVIHAEILKSFVWFVQLHDHCQVSRTRRARIAMKRWGRRLFCNVQLSWRIRGIRFKTM